MGLFGRRIDLGRMVNDGVVGVSCWMGNFVWWWRQLNGGYGVV